MKQEIVIYLFIPIVLMGLGGCLGASVAPDPGPMSQDAVPLDIWLEKEAFPQIAWQLKNSTFIKDLSFIILKANGKQIENRIDRLSADVRERLELYLQSQGVTSLVFRQPLTVDTLPNRLVDLKCGAHTDYDMILAIELKQLGGCCARIAFQFIEIGQDKFAVPAIYANQVTLSHRQGLWLQQVDIDEKLNGLKYLPFRATQIDDMAAFLAHNLSCIFREGYRGREIPVYIQTDTAATPYAGKTAQFLRKQMNRFNELQLVRDAASAEWVIQLEALETGPGTRLYQVWVEVGRIKEGRQVKGLSTFAYFTDLGEAERDISGIWKISKPEKKAVFATLVIKQTKDGSYRGDFYDGRGAILKKAVDMHVNQEDIDWIYYSVKQKRTFEAKGVIQNDRKAVIEVTQFPSTSKPETWELTR